MYAFEIWVDSNIEWECLFWQCVNEGSVAQQLLAKMGSSRNSYILMVGVQINTVTLESNLATSSKVKDD